MDISKSYVWRVLTQRKNDATLEPLRKSVEQLVATRNRPALLTQLKMISDGISEGTHTAEQKAIVEAGLSALGRTEAVELLQKKYDTYAKLDELITTAPRDTLVKVIQGLSPEARRAFEDYLNGE